jgi:hypothetical protein
MRGLVSFDANTPMSYWLMVGLYALLSLSLWQGQGSGAQIREDNKQDPSTCNLKETWRLGRVT